MSPMQTASKARLVRRQTLTIPIELLLESGHKALVFRYGSNVATVRKQIQPPLKLGDFMLQYKQIAQIQFVEATEHEI